MESVAENGRTSITLGLEVIERNTQMSHSKFCGSTMHACWSLTWLAGVLLDITKLVQGFSIRETCKDREQAWTDHSASQGKEEYRSRSDVRFALARTELEPEVAAGLRFVWLSNLRNKSCAHRRGSPIVAGDPESLQAELQLILRGTPM